MIMKDEHETQEKTNEERLVTVTSNPFAMWKEERAWKKKSIKNDNKER